MNAQALKRIFVVLALLGMMAGLRFAEVEAPVAGAADPLTLAAIGFVVLAAFAVAELGGAIGLPKVTGYIVSGIVLGPYVGGVLSPPVVEQMGMFKTLAVGLIALTAGLELETKALRKLATTLSATVGAKILITMPLVGFALLGVEMSAHVLGLETAAQAQAIALVFAALSLGTSPSIALAIISESGAKGRLSELVLGAAVLKDLVVVVTLAICVAIAKAMTGAGGGIGEAMIHVSEELLFSVIAGAAVGLILWAYMAWVQAEMLLFVAAIVLVGAEAAHAFHLELLLIFIVAGFLIRNFTDHGHDLHHPLELVSLPVFVVFFTTAGADIDIDTTVHVLPIAVVLVVARALGYYLSARIGNKLGKEPPEVGNNAWYAYMPQAGVTLGLVDLAAGKLPEIQDEILALGMAFVAINLLVGPLLLGKALERAGELPKAKDQESGKAAGEAASAVDEGELPLVPLDPLSDELLERIESLREQVQVELVRSVREHVQTWIAPRQRALANLDAESVKQITALAENPPRSDARTEANQLAALYEKVANFPQHLETTIRAPLEPRWLKHQDGERRLTRLRRIVRRVGVTLGSRRARSREIPLRLIAREAFEPRLATGMLELFRTSCRTDAHLADTLRRRLEGSIEPAAVGEALDVVLADFRAAAEADVRALVEASCRRMHLMLARIDTPVMPINDLDVSEAAKGIDRELAALLSEAEQWPEVADSCWQTVEVSARIRRLDDRLLGERKDGRRDSAADLREACTVVDEELGAFARRLRGLREELEGHDAVPDEELGVLATRARALLPKPASKRLRQAEQRLRRASESRQLHQALREAATRDTGAKHLVGPELVLAAPIPAEVRTRQLDVRELIDGEIAGRVLPTTERALDGAAQLITETQQSAATLVGDVELLIDVYRRHESKDATLDNLRAGLEGVQARGEQLLQEAVASLSSAAETVAVEFEGLGDRLAAALHDATGTGDPSRWASRRTDIARRQVGRELSRAREQAVELWGTVRGQLTSLAETLSSDYRLRSGLSLPSAVQIAKLIEDDNALRVRSDYAALFADQPIRDPRFFVANREVLRTISRAERSWQQQRTGNAVLIVGGPGSGKTSLLNVATLKLSTRELLWIPARRVDFIEALAGELHCKPEREFILRRLFDRPRVIVIDDLERMLPANADAIEQLEQLTQLIAETAASCFWVVATSHELQRLLAPRWPLRVGFSEMIELGHLSVDELSAVILARHRISHLELNYPLSGARALLARLLERDPSGQQHSFFVSLARTAKGNLRAALSEWCRAGAIEGDVLTLDRLSRPRALPFVRQLPTTALALLTIVLRYGPCTRATLAASLLRAEPELERWFHFLVTAGLLARHERGGADDTLYCPAHVRDALAPELRDLSVFHQEVS